MLLLGFVQAGDRIFGQGEVLLVWSHQLTSDLQRCLLFCKCLQWPCMRAVLVPTFVIGGLRSSTATSGSCWMNAFLGFARLHLGSKILMTKARRKNSLKYVGVSTPSKSEMEWVVRLGHRKLHLFMYAHTVCSCCFRTWTNDVERKMLKYQRRPTSA